MKLTKEMITNTILTVNNCSKKKNKLSIKSAGKLKTNSTKT